MNFKFTVNHKIPQSSWCMKLQKDCEVVEVELGSAVPFNQNFFFSGVWDGDFKTGGFDEASFVCGTGAKLENWGGVKLCTSTHLLEAIYLIKKQGLVIASNSLPFVLKRSGCKLDTNYMDYQRDMCSSIFGLDNQICSSPLSHGTILEYIRCCSVIVDKNLNIIKSENRSGLQFKNFEEYIASVRAVLSRIKSNAEDKARIKPYGMFTTISRGYDATATSALVKEIGCNRVLTFNRPGSYAEDCGSDIASKLGYEHIIEADANQYLADCDCIDAENMSTGDLSAAVLNAHKKEFADCLLFMGVRGDSLWERGHVNVNDRQDFTAGNTLQQADHSITESCFDVNAVCVPVPMIGSDCWSQLDAISQSEEMMPWRVNDKYDRPIARRIVEEKGVPRQWFGQYKHGMGASYHFDTYKHMKNKISKSSGKSLDTHRKSFNPSKFKHLKSGVRFYYNEFTVYFNYIANKLKLPIRLKSSNKHISSPLSPLLINWAIVEIQKRY